MDKEKIKESKPIDIDVPVEETEEQDIDATPIMCPRCGLCDLSCDNCDFCGTDVPEQYA